MTKAVATVLQARSELSAQALVAQGTRAGRDTQVRGCPERSEGSRCPWICRVWQEFCCPGRRCGRNAEVGEQLGLPIAEGPGGHVPRMEGR